MSSYQRLREAIEEYVEDAVQANPNGTKIKIPRQLFHAYVKENASGTWIRAVGFSSPLDIGRIQVIKLQPEEEP